MKDTFNTAAYGGDGWLPRQQTHWEEIGAVWADYALCNEWGRLRAVLLHRPGAELSGAGDPNRVQMLAPLDLSLAQHEHDQMAQGFRDNGVLVHMLEPAGEVTPNQMFCADLFAMTPQGAILARPASTVRAGEERAVARRLADLGVPILKTLTGCATFEAADLIWINADQALLGLGLRTNRAAAAQIVPLLSDLGVAVMPVDMPCGTMHLMGMVRIVDRDLAIARLRRTPHAVVVALRQAGYEVLFLPEQGEAEHNRAFNFVTLGPRKILMVADNPVTTTFYESIGIECVASPASELGKAAGAIGCLSGILSRDRSD